MNRVCVLLVCLVVLLSDVSAKRKKLKEVKPTTSGSTTSYVTGTTAPNGVTEGNADVEGTEVGTVTNAGTVTEGREGGTVAPTVTSTSAGELEVVTKVVEVVTEPADDDDKLYTEIIVDGDETPSANVGTNGMDLEPTEAEVKDDSGTTGTGGTTGTSSTEGTAEGGTEAAGTEGFTTGTAAGGTEGGTTGTGGTWGTGSTGVTTEAGVVTTEPASTFSTEFLTTPDKRFGFICPSYMYSCRRTEKCIGMGMVCDGKDDCGGNDDEKDCPEPEGATEPGAVVQTIECDNGEIKCAASNTCVQSFLACNGIRDCPDGEDEQNCPFLSCTHDHTLCADQSLCVPNIDWCDGKEQCPDGSDEASCAAEIQCSFWESQCRNGDCIESIYWCDGYYDCWDGSDEEAEECGPIEFKKRR